MEGFFGQSGEEFESGVAGAENAEGNPLDAEQRGPRAAKASAVAQEQRNAENILGLKASFIQLLRMFKGVYAGVGLEGYR